jgi:hypothetical protein
VPVWVSFGEPNSDSTLLGNYGTAYQVLKAHAELVRWYRNEIKGTGKWSLKLSLPFGFGLPLDATNRDHVAAANRYMDFGLGYYANPLYLGLPVPRSVSETLGSKAPNFTAEELAVIKGTCDIFAMDIYVASYITPVAGGIDACAANASHPAFPVCVTSSPSRNGWDVGYKSNAYPYVRLPHFGITSLQSLSFKMVGYITFVLSLMIF